MGMIPAQTQLQTALAINLGTEGRAVSRSEHHCLLSLHLHFPCHATTSHYSVFALYISLFTCVLCPVVIRRPIRVFRSTTASARRN